MYRILGINRKTFKVEDVAFAQNRAELKIMMEQERASGAYQAVWYVRA